MTSTYSGGGACPPAYTSSNRQDQDDYCHDMSALSLDLNPRVNLDVSDLNSQYLDRSAVTSQFH